MDLHSDQLLANDPLDCGERLTEYVVGEVGIEDSLPFSEESQESRYCDDSSNDSIDFSMPIKRILQRFNEMVCKKLDSMDTRMDDLSRRCCTLEEKVDAIATLLTGNDATLPDERSGEVERPGGQRPTVMINVADGQVLEDGDQCGDGVYSSGAQLLQLNSEVDFPNGSWLGDEKNPEMRVRCRISPTDLFHVNVSCHTAEKMSLTLLDYLFDRDEQAVSNISGNGKNKKKQLDPLMIYGVQCHLMSKFGITEKDWHRIKQNLDSKCRTAYRRKIRGLPNTVKRLPIRHGKSSSRPDHSSVAGGSGSSHDRHESTSSSTEFCDVDAESSDAAADEEEVDQSATNSSQMLSFPVVDGQSDFATVLSSAQVIHTLDGPIQVQIQFLDESDILMAGDQ